MSAFTKYLVKWDDSYLAPFDFSNSVESRTHVKSSAQRFKSIRSAQLRIAKIKRFKGVINYEIQKEK